jgi:hypothetical protein
MKKIVFFILFTFLIGCGSDYSQKGSVNNGSRLSNYCIETKCIEGHIYYFNTGYNAGGIAPKLHSDGTPYKCDE